MNYRIQAFLMTLRFSEGTSGENGYRMIFSGKLFDSFSDHPRFKITSGKLISDAAGAYQFMSFTWDELKNKLGLKDFSPQSQDIACLELISNHNALNDVYLGKFEIAVNKLNKTWASLPNSPYGQPTHSMEILKEYYTKELA